MVVAGTGAIVSPAHDPRALAACIESYRIDPERCAREGKAGRELALARYDPEVVVEDWVTRLRGVAQRRRVSDPTNESSGSCSSDDELSGSAP